MARPATLAQAIALSGLKLQYLADVCGITRGTFRGKLRGDYDWKLSELCIIQDALHMGDDFWQMMEDEWRRANRGRKE